VSLIVKSNRKLFLNTEFIDFEKKNKSKKQFKKQFELSIEGASKIMPTSPDTAIILVDFFMTRETNL